MADHGDSQTNNDQTIARLELALEAEKQRSAGLREELAGVQQQLDGLESRLEARLEERIAEIKARAEKAEAKLKDQNERLDRPDPALSESLLDPLMADGLEVVDF